jgi:thymidylate kinase
MSRTGKIVAILGPDGSGKSTLLTHVLQRAILESRYNAIHHYHWRPGILPQLAFFKGGSRTGEMSDTPHGALPASKLSSAIRASYYASDYILAWPILRSYRRQGALVLFDRYFDDLLVDPRRIRLAPGSRAAGVLGRLVPRPDVTLLLMCDPKTAHERKKELTIEEIERQQALYRAIAKDKDDWHVIDTNRPLEQCVEQACELAL